MDKAFIIKKKDTKTTAWSGGKTTELFIYPDDSDFKSLNFDFRISTATIEVDESTFTPLPNINRTLVLLDGKLKLEHKDHHSINLELYESDSFSGSWETKSYGKAIDFNFMSTKNLNELVNVLPLKKSSQITERCIDETLILFVYKGEISTSIGKISEGDLIVNPKKGIFEYQTLKNSVIVRISLKVD